MAKIIYNRSNNYAHRVTPTAKLTYMKLLVLLPLCIFSSSNHEFFIIGQWSCSLDWSFFQTHRIQGLTIQSSALQIRQKIQPVIQFFTVRTTFMSLIYSFSCLVFISCLTVGSFTDVIQMPLQYHKDISYT